MSRLRTAGRSAPVAAVAGAAAAEAALRHLLHHPPRGAARWMRTNARGREVSLVAGPALVLGVTAGALVAGGPGRTRTVAVVVVLGAGCLGLHDDLAGSAGDRGLRGHLTALRAGRLTTGAVKVVGLAGLGAGAGLALRPGPVDALLAGVVVAGGANLVNLLDLRPGRALKVGLAAGSVLLRQPSTRALAAGTLGAVCALLPPDLHERVMLGDAGANALGAALGVLAVGAAGRRGLLAGAVALVALTLASERVSFTAVIARTPVLRELDALGRLP